MRANAQVLRDADVHGDRADVWFRIAGLAVAALLPALFWTVVTAAVARFTGFEISTAALAYTGSGIGLFLTAVCAPLIVNA
jgi:cytochrome b